MNEAYDGLGATYNFYWETLRRNSIDDQGLALNGHVHYGNKYPNAFWDGRRMVFGDGDGVLFQQPGVFSEVQLPDWVGFCEIRHAEGPTDIIALVWRVEYPHRTDAPQRPLFATTLGYRHPGARPARGLLGGSDGGPAGHPDTWRGLP